MKKKILSIILLSTVLSACNSTSSPHASGLQTKYIDPTRESASSGVGIESNDVIGMADKMVRSILNDSMISTLDTPPRVVVDETNFTLDGNARINRKLITTRLRNGLSRAAKGKMVFVARHGQAAIMKERALKAEGLVDTGTIRQTKAVAGVDFKLMGSILTNDERHANGTTSRYHFINFELIDMELGVIVWSDGYEFKKTGVDDVVYR